MTDARTGTVVAGFMLDSVVARSEIATTYRGHRGDTIAAVKISCAEWAQRADREQQAHLRVEHRCVARLLGAGRLPCGSRFLVSAWIGGESLEQRLARPVEWQELVPILAAVAAGLVAIRAAHLVHRDLKPTNIMLPDDGQPAAVILDLGHSLLLGAERLTDRGHVLGSAAYMAPEQAAGGPIDDRADLYALGVIVYRALTGVLPFDGHSAAELLRCHQIERVVPPRRRAPERSIPLDAEDLCMWLLAKRPEHRVPSAHVLAATLHAVQCRHVSFAKEKLA